jgi:hypothetical protein
MREGLTGIDHVVVLVRDLDAAEDAWRALGFAPTPRGRHTLGSLNHCFMFDRDYVELLAVPVPHPSMQYFTEFLARGEGLGAFAFSASDGLAAHAAFVRDGIAADPPFEFSRPVERAGGRDARFRIVQLPADQTPGLRAFVCQHFTPELVWLPEDRVHPNGATGIAGLAVCCDDPARVAASYARLAGVPVIASPVAGAHRVRIGAVDVDLATRRALADTLPGVGLPDGAGPQVAVLRIAVADAAVAERCVRASGVRPVRVADGSFAVPASAASGVAVVFSGP